MLRSLYIWLKELVHVLENAHWTTKTREYLAPVRVVAWLEELHFERVVSIRSERVRFCMNKKRRFKSNDMAARTRWVDYAHWVRIVNKCILFISNDAPFNYWSFFNFQIIRFKSVSSNFNLICSWLEWRLRPYVSCHSWPKNRWNSSWLGLLDGRVLNLIQCEEIALHNWLMLWRDWWMVYSMKIDTFIWIKSTNIVVKLFVIHRLRLYKRFRLDDLDLTFFVQKWKWFHECRTWCGSSNCSRYRGIA